MNGAILNKLKKQLENMKKQIDDDQQKSTEKIRSAEENLNKICELFENEKRKYEKKYAELKREKEKVFQEILRDWEFENGKINKEISSGQGKSGLQLLRQYESKFEQRQKFIDKIPDFPLNFDELKRIFTINELQEAQTTVVMNEKTEDDDYFETWREKMRKKDDIEDELGDDETERSTEIKTQPVDNIVPKTFTEKSKIFGISTRLYQKAASKPIPRTILPTEINYLASVQPKFVREYFHNERNSVLITFNAEWIVLFQWAKNRIDKWDLARIHRANGDSKSLKWDEGLIRSIGFFGQRNIFAYTDTKFFKYNIMTEMKDYRILQKTNARDDDDDLSRYRFGTFHDGYFYDAFLNNQRSWRLAIIKLKDLSLVVNLGLSSKVPDLVKLIDIDVYEIEIHLLARLEDSSLSIIFCSAIDGTPSERCPRIQLEAAVEPTEIFSSFSTVLDRLLIFVNDPTAEMIHITDQTTYLYSLRIVAHSIYSSKQNNELMLVCDKSIQSISF